MTKAAIGRARRARLRVAAAVALAALTAGPAAAHGSSRGERAFARHDYVGALPLLEREAEAGSAVAATELGYMYEYGLGAPQNYDEAARWISRAARQGQPTAQYLLGLLYDKGFGVPQDYVQAEVWLSLAAARADDRHRDYWAQLRDAVARNLSVDELAEAQKRALAWRPGDPAPASAN